MSGAKKAMFSQGGPVTPFYSIGSMASGSNTLTLTSNAGGTYFRSGTPSQRIPFAIGHKIIVEIGGEAGGGQHGTVGVGGVHVATGANYWQGLDAPKALVATVTGVSGNVLTLGASSVAATTNARVYRDNSDDMEAEFDAKAIADPEGSITWPAGTFAVRDYVHTAMVSLVGQGRGITVIMSPKGADRIGIQPAGSTATSHPVIRDLTIIGNCLWHGFGIPEDGEMFWVSCGVWCQYSSNITVERIEVIDIFKKAVWFEGGDLNQAIDCSMYQRQPLQGYMAQWYFGANDSSRCSIIRCKVVGMQYLTPGFETFRSSGAQFIDCESQNGMFAANSSGSWLLENFKFTSTPNCWFSDAVGVHHTAGTLDINSHVQPPDAAILLGGTVRNINFECLGPTDPIGNYLIGARVSINNPNITFDGGIFKYPLISNVDTAGVECTAQGIHIRNTPPAGPENILADGVTVIGHAPDWFGNIRIDGPNAQAIDCVAEYIYVNDVLQT